MMHRLLSFLILLPSFLSMEFQDVSLDISDSNKTSVSIFFFGVKAVEASFQPGSNILFNCEYHAPPGTEVAFITIGKLDNDKSYLYQLQCGRKKDGSELYVHKTAARNRDNADELLLVRASDIASDKCATIPKQAGGVLFELTSVGEEDVGEFACSVHLKGKDDLMHKRSQTIRNNKCLTNRCIQVNAEKKYCLLTCEQKCIAVGAGWMCDCNAGYRLAEDMLRCQFMDD